LIRDSAGPSLVTVHRELTSIKRGNGEGGGISIIFEIYLSIKNDPPKSRNMVSKAVKTFGTV